jgi:Site-specific recombinase XerD
MAVNFYLDKRTDKNGDAPIRISVMIGGARLLTSVGYSINPLKWDSSKQKVKQGASNGRGIMYSIINSHLNSIEQQCIDFENRCLNEKIKVTTDIIKQEIVTKSKPDKATKHQEKGFLDRFDEFIKEAGTTNDWVAGTYAKFAAIRNHIIGFLPQPTFELFNETGLTEYISYLRSEKGLRNSTIGKHLGFLKWFLRWATNKGYNQNTAFVSYKAKLKTTENRVIFLTWDELMTVYNFQISESKKYLDRVRDVFCFCCFTSLRYSDVYNLKLSDIRNEALHITTVKTADTITIELNKYSKMILDKYEGIPFADNKALPVISNQKMNDYIKELGELCGIDQPQTITYYVGNKRVDEVYPKYELMGTHTGRRTFICNAIIMGIPPQVVMKWTGHNDYKAMKPYIDIADQAKAEAMKMFNTK